MTRTVSVTTANRDLSKLLDDVRGGGEIILTKRGIPYAKLMPVDVLPKRKLGFLGPIEIPESFYEPLPLEEMKGWE